MSLTSLLGECSPDLPKVSGYELALRNMTRSKSGMALPNSFQELCESLKALSSAVEKASTEMRTFNEMYGVSCPMLDRVDLSMMIDSLAERLESNWNEHELAEDDDNCIRNYTKQIDKLKAQVGHLFSGSGAQAAPMFVSTISGMEVLLGKFLVPQWQRFDDPELMPKQIGQRIRGLNAHLNQIEPELGGLSESIKLIRDARATAQSLPVDLEMLQAATTKVKKLGGEADADRLDIGTSLAMVRSTVEKVAQQHSEAEKLIKQLRDLHRVGTSTTLAGAFDTRAKSLSNSVWGWLTILVCALIGGVFIGSTRISAISDAMSLPVVHWEGIWVNVFLTVFSVSAPVWLGWVATKQIIQRFRLAEDYAYKASISNAYEGYRREAVDLDQAFRDKLFGSALTRLDELPGRLVDNDTHGSPFHELLSSPVIRDALNLGPNFAGKVTEMAKTIVDAARKKQVDDTFGKPEKPTDGIKAVSDAA